MSTVVLVLFVTVFGVVGVGSCTAAAVVMTVVIAVVVPTALVATVFRRRR